MHNFYAQDDDTGNCTLAISLFESLIIGLLMGGGGV